MIDVFAQNCPSDHQLLYVVLLFNKFGEKFETRRVQQAQVELVYTHLNQSIKMMYVCISTGYATLAMLCMINGLFSLVLI